MSVFSRSQKWHVSKNCTLTNIFYRDSSWNIMIKSYHFKQSNIIIITIVQFLWCFSCIDFINWYYMYLITVLYVGIPRRSVSFTRGNSRRLLWRLIGKLSCLPRPQRSSLWSNCSFFSIVWDGPVQYSNALKVNHCCVNEYLLVFLALLAPTSCTRSREKLPPAVASRNRV